MEIGGVANMTYGAQATGKAKGNDEMDKDAFLKLLVTQLQNQDPLEPTDNTEFVAQLAQFSSLEGINNLNTSMDGISRSITGMQDISSAGLVGRFARTEGSTFEAINGVDSEFGFEIDSPASSVKVSIADSKGRVVRNLDMGSLPTGDHRIAWDRTDNEGMQLGAGAYTFKITAVDAQNKTVIAAPYTTGLITSVGFDSGVSTLKVNGMAVSRNDIREIY